MIDQAILNELSAIAQNYETCNFEFIKENGDECLMLEVGGGNIRIIPYPNGDYLLLIGVDSDNHSITLEHTPDMDTLYFLEVLEDMVGFYKDFSNPLSTALKATYYAYKMELKRRGERL